MLTTKEIWGNAMKKCPVCGTDAFEEDGAYEDCPICGWTDDVYQERFPDKSGGANFPVSLNRAKEDYLISKIKIYDTVLLKNGNKAQIVDLLDRKAFIADVEVDGEYDTITVYLSEIKNLLTSNG